MTTNASIRVVIADEHPTARRTLRLLLEGEPGCHVVAEASEPAMVSRSVQDCSPHVLVLNMHMNRGSTLQLIRELRRQAPGTAIVGMTMERSPAVARQALDSGATGFVLKDRADAELARAVRRAARGMRYVSPCVALALEPPRRGWAPIRPSARTRSPRTGERRLPAA